MITATHDQIVRASDIISGGGIVVFPTDTAFGVGCRMDLPHTVERLFEIRRRPPTQATPVLVASHQTALEYFEHPDQKVRELMDLYWPGALTIVSPCKTENVYGRVRGDGNSLGMRMPNHGDILEIIRLVGVPILGPSANFHGAPTPYRYEDLDPEFARSVDMVVPGVCPVGSASTVVSVAYGSVRVLREGAVRI